MLVKHLRGVGVFACLTSTMLFMGGGLTEHWVDSDDGHWGLWKICEDGYYNSTGNVTVRSGGSIRSTTTTNSYGDDSEEHDSRDSDSHDDDDYKGYDYEEESCTHFDITSIPAFLHILRGIVMLSGLVLAWGVLSGRSLRLSITREETFAERHKSELLGIIACLLIFFALFLFTHNYKKIREDSFHNSKMGNSYLAVRFSIYVYVVAALLMMSPSIPSRYRRGNGPDCDVCGSFGSLCVRIGLTKPPESPARGAGNNGANIHRRRSTVVSVDSEMNYQTHIGTHDVNLQMSETDSDIFTVNVRNDDNDVSFGPSSPGNDLPQYEDVGPPSPSLAPPPSYNDVIEGGYLAFSLPPVPTAESTGSSSNMPPPPAYDSVA